MKFVLKAALAISIALGSITTPASSNEVDSRGGARTVVVPLAPGGAGDKLGRMLAQRLTEETGRTYIVDNKPGAGGNIAAAHVAKAKNDGSTLLLTTGGMLTLNPHIYKNIAFDPIKDFTHIAKWVDSPNILFVRTETPVNNFDQFMTWAKSGPQPLKYGSAGIGSSQHLAAELFQTRTGVEFLHVPYRGGTPAVQDLVSGLLDFSFSTTAGLAMMNAGRLKPLVVTSTKRLSMLPDIPTIAESGYPGFDASAWYGVVGPAGMSDAEVAIVQRAVEKLARDEKLAAALEAEALIVDYRDPAAFKQYVQQELDSWGA
ncbi:Bug family tripartite tricarboxylate transporter substrate binding protein [Bordetella sp. 02P26C-1]|uniref:Bug family tripartite tricarboxylate transporter substrate binding protein n=1 Tax=Bordetella sp. 02P26C-1 TaxID=2683195 RepID=UPI0013656588|nr:tripartite tricarboxylate transporter substrate binding protein [Bordetella sp. 02P26C-1]